MPYILDGDLIQVIDALEAIADFSDDERIKDHTKRALKTLKKYRK